MGFVLDAIFKILQKRTFWSVISELLLFVAPLWVAVVVGLLVGWAWRPSWAAGLVGREESRSDGSRSSWASARFDFLKNSFSRSLSKQKPEREQKVESEFDSIAMEIDGLAVGREDLANLWRLSEERDNGPGWIHMMEKSLPTMSYEAWRRDPDVGPPQYRSRTVFEDATPEDVRDFFGDDYFRLENKWDDMLIFHNTLEECPTTGTMIVHWIRKFPFFCSNREYIIGRRIWKSGRTYYCVTKGVPYPSVPRQKKPRRVDLYYSSWCIRPVESKRTSSGELTACEVLLFHHEDMGIPYEIAKLGIRQGMWGCVKRIEPGLRAYQAARMAGAALSPSALMAHINTDVGTNLFHSLGSDSTPLDIVETDEEKPRGHNLRKFLVFGGAVALACTLDQGLLTKVLIFGVARRFVGRKK